MRLLLQNRWKQNGNRLFYYGLRHEPYTFQTSVRLSKKELPLIKKAVCGASFTEKESQAARRLIRLGALVLPEAYPKHIKRRLLRLKRRLSVKPAVRTII